MSPSVRANQRLLWAIIRASKPAVETPLRPRTFGLSRHLSSSPFISNPPTTGFSVSFDDLEPHVSDLEPKRTKAPKNARKEISQKANKDAANSAHTGAQEPIQDDEPTTPQKSRRKAPKQRTRNAQGSETPSQKRMTSHAAGVEAEPSPVGLEDETKGSIKKTSRQRGPRGLYPKRQQKQPLEDAQSSDLETDQTLSVPVIAKKSRHAPRPTRSIDHDDPQEQEETLATGMDDLDAIEKRPTPRTKASSTKPIPSSSPSQQSKPDFSSLPPPKRKFSEPWQSQKAALAQKFNEAGWSPRRKLSPDALEGIRSLHASDPSTFTTPQLAEKFKISPEAIRRILKSKWRPADEEGMQDRRERWARRHDRIWDQRAALGLRPAREEESRVPGRRSLKRR